MSFNVDYSQASEGSQIAPGVYECIIKDPHEAASKQNIPFLSIPMVIRNDLDQRYKNAFIWYALRKKHDPTPADIGVNGYSAKQIATLSKAVKLPNGKSYSGIEEWLKDLDGKLVRIEVKPMKPNADGREFPDYGYPGETQHPECKHVMKQKAAAAKAPALPAGSATGGFTQVDEDELPF